MTKDEHDRLVEIDREHGALVWAVLAFCGLVALIALRLVFGGAA